MPGTDASARRWRAVLYEYTVTLSRGFAFPATAAPLVTSEGVDSMPSPYRQSYRPSRIRVPTWVRKAWAWL